MQDSTPILSSTNDTRAEQEQQLCSGISVKVSLSDVALYSEVRVVQMNCHLSGGRVMGNLPILPILMPARARARNAD